MIALQSNGLDRGEVRAHVDRILQGDEFQHSGTLFRWIDEKLSRAVEWFGDLIGVPDPRAAQRALVVFLVVLACALLWALYRTLRDARRAPAGDGTAAFSEEAVRAAGVAALRRAARAAAAAHDHIGALRLYFRALVLGLSERGELRYRDAWTNRELLERGAPRAEVLPLLAPLVPHLDAQSFGHEPAGADDVARLADLCDRLLGGQGA
ncbi:MAG TPA: hypothetical protein VGR31_09785 [Planctomycetota bacterium]|jgi:hypothetical protein|nr:hypothetical protein [Planctomycetota bacterium]